MSATGTALAEQQAHHLSIASQSISDALKALAAETHMQIFSRVGWALPTLLRDITLSK